LHVKLTGTAEQNKALQTELAESDSFSGVEFFDTLLENFNQMIKGLDIIVLVLIVSSASLAGVVLGNLTNVNISERMREIATLKVLGFRRKEVENYIYKENNILTFIGSLVGIPLGMLLHHYIMHQVEMDYIMFGRK
jgi:putative ABC transport system permease protein